jgi:hypothetical protein
MIPLFLQISAIRLVADLDPNILNLMVDFLLVCFKYAIFFGLSIIAIRMLVRAFTGKERFL